MQGLNPCLLHCRWILFPLNYQEYHFVLAYIQLQSIYQEQTQVLSLIINFSCTISVHSVIHSCLTLCNSMDCSTPVFPVHYQLPECAQTRVHQVSNGTQPSCPGSSTSTPAFNLSQHQGLFQRISSLHEVAKILEFQLQHQSFQ